MEGWNAQMMLDLYIYDYLIKNNLHTVAEIFAAEANLAPKPVALDSPEGFLSEWWSVFWSIYSSRIPVNIETTEGSSSKASQSGGNAPLVIVHPTRVVPSRDINFVPNVTCTSNMPPTVDPTVMPNPNIEKLHCPISATMRRPDSNLNGVIPIRISDPSVLEGEKLKNLIDAMQNQERLRLPSDQLSHMLPSSSNRSHPPEKIYKKHPPLRIVEDDSFRTSLRIEEPIARAPGQDNLSHSIENLYSNSQLLDADQLACLLSSSDNCSSPQKNLYKTSRLSTTRDEERGTSSRRPGAAEATHNAPEGRTNWEYKFQYKESSSKSMEFTVHCQINSKGLQLLNYFLSEQVYRHASFLIYV